MQMPIGLKLFAAVIAFGLAIFSAKAPAGAPVGHGELFAALLFAAAAYIAMAILDAVIDLGYPPKDPRR